MKPIQGINKKIFHFYIREDIEVDSKVIQVVDFIQNQIISIENDNVEKRKEVDY